MDAACTTQDQRKRRRARISAALKKSLACLDELVFSRCCAHCKVLLKKPKERLCAPCQNLIDPRSAAFGCKRCLVPLREIDEEKNLEECLCKQKSSFTEVLYLEPMGGVLESLIQTKALEEEREVTLALSAYLLQIAIETGQPLPDKILTYKNSKEELWIQRALEKMLKSKRDLKDIYFYLANRAPKYFSKLIINRLEGKTLWIVGIKKNGMQTKIWKDLIRAANPENAILFFISCG